MRGKKKVITYHHCTIENLGTKVETLRKKKKKKELTVQNSSSQVE